MVSVWSRQATDLVTLEALELLSRSVKLPNLWLSQEKDGFNIHQIRDHAVSEKPFDEFITYLASMPRVPAHERCN